MSQNEERRIPNDKVFEKVSDGLVKWAQEIDEMRAHPLTPPEKLAAKQQEYDEWAGMARAYRIRDLVREDPSTRASYEELGLIGKDEEL